MLRTDAPTFIERWQGAAVLPATELATAQSFVRDLCDLLGVEHPHPSEPQEYEFERPVTFTHGDGSTSPGRIDCYKRGAFVLEAKKLRNAPQGRAFDSALLAARAQAEAYARALPAEEGRPPFVIVVDVGRVIELYSEFTRTGGTYTPFPDPRSHRIALADLAEPVILDRLRAVWTEPMSLDPTRIATRVTRHIAERLAEVAKALEDSGHDLKDVAAFLSRCLFTMFSEDIGLLPKRGFVSLLEKYRDKSELLAQQTEQLWTAMDRGEFSALLEQTLLRFNGKLFKDHRALVLKREQIDLLIAAARADWRQVEPAIFGTLLERALDYRERHALGAHFTPRAYVERLVQPTIVEPLREDWSHAQTAAMVLIGEGKRDAAQQHVREFLIMLCQVRVLDPACGSGNFLYIALEHLKRLEGEVLDFLDQLGDTRGRLDLAGASVDPHQLLGLEVNPRAAAITEMVLWIGYLQWHYRTRGNVNPPLPVLKDFQNIECRDAVLAYDKVEAERDENGIILTRWDGVTTKVHPATGREVPNELARVPVERYTKPRPADWPEADFVVGNPPFIGNKRMRIALGDGYVEAIRSAWKDVPDSADFVMYWWEKAANLAQAGKIRRFGLITTNSVRQSFNRRVLERHLSGDPPLSLKFAIPDHPWVDNADGAAVRIAMTVGAGSASEDGTLWTPVREDPHANDDDTAQVSFDARRGIIHADLRVGTNLARAVPLLANSRISNRGVIPHGEGFYVSIEEVRRLTTGGSNDLDGHIRVYRNGRDIASRPRDVFVIDFYGLRVEEARAKYAAAYQHLLDRVKPERDQNPRKSRRENWWLFGENQPLMRRCITGLSKYIVTIQAAKHRYFVFVGGDVLPDDKLIVIGSDRASILGVLSSRIHVTWALASGARLGVGNDPVYNKTTCFEQFPFPILTASRDHKISALTLELDALRSRQRAQHAELTLTSLYNVLEKLRRNETLNEKERGVCDRGLVSVMRELHDELDRAVFDAYGWSDLGPELIGLPGATIPYLEKTERQLNAEEELLSRLVKLNTTRAAEEARGIVRWLRPEFQTGAGVGAVAQGEMEVETEATGLGAGEAKRPWPKEAPAQAKAIAEVLINSELALSLDDVAGRFSARGRWKERLEPMLEMLIVLGKARAITRDGEKLYSAIQ